MSLELQTLITELLPPTRGIRLTEVTVQDESVQLQLTAIAPTALCPDCAVPSSSIHSRYQRRLTDLPWGSLAIRMQLIVRKFVCRHLTCARRIFTERLPDFVAPYARKTMRLVNALQAIGIALGGQAGTRLAARLRLPTSPATLLRLVRATPVPHTPALQAVGIDEWAWQRGHRYGTILVDLATHRVVDLLPDRSAATVAAWLAQHPTITVVCRDRSDLVRGRHSPGRARGGAGRRALSSGGKPPRSGGSVLAEPVGGPPSCRRAHGPGADALHSLSDPPLAREWSEQRPALARDSGPRLYPLRPHRLPLHHPAAARSRSRTGPRGTGLTIHPSPGTVRTCSVVRHDLPRCKAIRARADVCGPALPHESEHRTRLCAEPGVSGDGPGARGRQEDLAAVTAGLTLAWSHGVTEGQMHRLTLGKRQSSGRAGFALLRPRVLQAASRARAASP